jgi:chemotaxis protein MotB
MRLWGIPSPRLRRSLAALAAGALLLSACVTRGTHDRVVGERDQVSAERDSLRNRVELLEASNQALSEERVVLLEETESLRETRAELEASISAAEQTLVARESALADTEAALDAQRRAHDDAVAAAEAELASIRDTYDGLVTDLQSEVEENRVQIEHLREGAGFTLPSEVVFGPGSAQPTAAGRKVLLQMGQRLGRGDERIEVHGHTDSLPTSGASASRYPTNWELAGARAASVVRILVESGVDPERIVAVSHASFDPLTSNDTPDGRAQNRRIEIRLKALPEGERAAAPPAP